VIEKVRERRGREKRGGRRSEKVRRKSCQNKRDRQKLLIKKKVSFMV
jgi:hypothetical protein